MFLSNARGRTRNILKSKKKKFLKISSDFRKVLEIVIIIIRRSPRLIILFIVRKKLFNLSAFESINENCQIKWIRFYSFSLSIFFINSSNYEIL